MPSPKGNNICGSVSSAAGCSITVRTYYPALLEENQLSHNAHNYRADFFLQLSSFSWNLKRPSEDEISLLDLDKVLADKGRLTAGICGLAGLLSIILIASLSSQDPAHEQLTVATRACESWLHIGRST